MNYLSEFAETLPTFLLLNKHAALYLIQLRWLVLIIRQEEKYMREVANESKSLLLELEGLVAELHDMINCRTVSDAERLELKNKITALFVNG